jgi:hypothetical protein
LYGGHQSGAIWSSTFRTWVKSTLPLFAEAGAERCVYVKRQHADGTMVDLDKLRDITLEPGERLVILVINTNDLLILSTDSARTEVDAFEKLLAINHSKLLHEHRWINTWACTSPTIARIAF